MEFRLNFREQRELYRFRETTPESEAILPITGIQKY